MLYRYRTYAFVLSRYSNSQHIDCFKTLSAAPSAYPSKASHRPVLSMKHAHLGIWTYYHADMKHWQITSSSSLKVRCYFWDDQYHSSNGHIRPLPLSMLQQSTTLSHRDSNDTAEDVSSVFSLSLGRSARTSGISSALNFDLSSPSLHLLLILLLILLLFSAHLHLPITLVRRNSHTHVWLPDLLPPRNFRRATQRCHHLLEVQPTARQSLPKWIP